jgi:hypothetical protein
LLRKGNAQHQDKTECERNFPHTIKNNEKVSATNGLYFIVTLLRRYFAGEELAKA